MYDYDHINTQKLLRHVGNSIALQHIFDYVYIYMCISKTSIKQVHFYICIHLLVLSGHCNVVSKVFLTIPGPLFI